MTRWLGSWTLAAIACCGGGFLNTAQAAASEAEIRTYAELVRRLIDLEVQLPAQRRLNDLSKQYASPENLLVQALQLHYAHTFAATAEPAESKRLNELADKLEAALLPQVAKLPEDWVRIVKRDPSDIILANLNPLWRTVNPSLPLPAPELRPANMAALVTQRMDLIRATLDEALPAYRKAIDDHEATLNAYFEKPNPTQKDTEEGLFKAVQLRLDLVNSLYFTIKAANELFISGPDIGVSPDYLKGLDSWLGSLFRGEEQAQGNKGGTKKRGLNLEAAIPLATQFEDWEYMLADVNFTFRHRLLLCRLEAARGHGMQYYSFDEIQSSIDDFLLFDETQFTTASERSFVRRAKEELVSQVIDWSLAYAAKDASLRPQILDKAMERWKTLYRDIKPDLKARDPERANQVAENYIAAARLYRAAGRTSDALALMSEILAIKPAHAWAPNARAWQEAMLGGGNTTTASWGAAPEAMDPEAAYALALSLRRAAANSTDLDKAYGLRLSAAVALRNAIYSLSQPQYREVWVEQAPQIYQLSASMLKELGWVEHASVVAEAGLQAVLPRWGKAPKYEGNPWGDPNDREKLTEAGQKVQRLADDFWSYSGQAKRAYDSKVNGDRYAEAVTLRKLINPNAEGGEKTEIIVAIQDGSYDQAVKLAKNYGSKTADLGDRLWFQRMATYSLYLWLEEISKEKTPNADQMAKVEQQLNEELGTLNALAEPELAKGDQGHAEARKARSLALILGIETLRRNGEWPKIMTNLGPDFWQDPPELALQVKMLNALTNAAYQHRALVNGSQELQRDPESIIGVWKSYEHALAVLRQVEKTAGQPMLSSQKRLAFVFQGVSKHARWFTENIEKGVEGFADAPYDKLSRIAKAATIDYIDLLAPTLPAETPVETWVGLANDLWAVGAKQRATEYYERYLAEARKRDDLKAFAADPAGIVDAVGKAVLAARPLYRKEWEAIRDYLMDQPGFMEQYERTSGDRKQLSEEKRDFARAFILLDDFRKKMEKEKALLGDTSKLFPQVDALLETVKHLTWSVQFTSRLVEAYMDLGDTKRAVELAGELIKYDPLYPPYMMVFVEGVLLQGAKADKDSLKQAQKKAALVRNQTKGKAEMHMQYWVSSCQVMEISLLLGEVDLVKRMLARNLTDKDNPTVDLSMPNTNPRQAQDEGQLQVWKRYLRIYSQPGIDLKPNFSIAKDAEGNDIAVLAEGQ